MTSLALGTKADGSRVILTRPHGTAARVGSSLWRDVFFRFGRHRIPRTVIYVFLSPRDWYELQISNARVDLFFAYPLVN